MSKWNEAINGFFSNEELMSNIRSGIVLTLALGLGLLYFGFYSNFDLNTLLSIKTVGLTLTALLSNWLWRIDIEIRGFTDEIRENVELKSIEEDIQTESNSFEDYDSALEFVKDWNETQQDMFNKLKTEERENHLKQLLKYNKVRQKHWWNALPYFKPRNDKSINEELDALELNPLIDKTFKAITVNQLISVQKIKKNHERKGQDSIEYNPKREGTVRGLLFSLVKFLGIGGGGGMLFGITDSTKTIVIYYLMLLAALALTTFSRYTKVRKNTKTTYYNTRKNKLNLIKEMKDYKSQKKLPPPKEEI